MGVGHAYVDGESVSTVQHASSNDVKPSIYKQQIFAKTTWRLCALVIAYGPMFNVGVAGLAVSWVMAA